LPIKRTPIVLRFANAQSRQPEHEWFAEEVERVSAGALRVSFIEGWVSLDNRQEETAAVVAVMRGHADLAWAGTRAFGCLGSRSLDPLQTPFLLEDYSVLDTVCRDGVTGEMLEGLKRLGLVGLVVLPGPQRKPFAFARRLLGPRDYEGAKMRIHESLVASSAYRELNAEAVTLSPRQMLTHPHTLIDGLDIQTEALAGWGLRGSITFNVNLWPRTSALVAARRTMDWLGEAEREMLHAAAAGTLGRALDRLADQEGLDWDAIPPQVTPIYADDNEVTAIRERLTPVREELRRHPETGPVLERLELLAGRAARPSRTTPVREELRDRRRSESTVQPGH
jgi:TRAP-type C4-dicarboxylate transport system substrate-binding protein